ncbi:PDZ domain (Also known as DHR or GLGF) [Planctomycetes bacterium MalM25]|nr:PDZ domain (Also known as DHR or GLGF) [Planctomycetes bacterium MalM25]
MSRLSPATIFALASLLVFGLAAAANAGGCHKRWKPAPRPIYQPAPIHHPAPIHQPAPTLKPIGWAPAPTVVPARNWYFGMSLQITNTAYGRGLQVARVTPGSPAYRAGLEVGDVLLAAGSVSLQNAYSNEHGVQLLQSAVGSGAPAPTAAAAFVAPVSPTVQVTVIDVRTNQAKYVLVSPRLNGGGAPAPTFTAPAPVASTF